MIFRVSIPFYQDPGQYKFVQDLLLPYKIGEWEYKLGDDILILEPREGNLIFQLRNSLINDDLSQNKKQKINLNYRKSLWLDTDNRPKIDDIFHIIKLSKKYDVIALPYPAHDMPAWVCGNFGHNMDSITWDKNKGSGIEVKDWSGFGFIAIDKSVYERLEHPWFAHPVEEFGRNNSKARPIGEDVYFCRKLKEAGIKLHIDWEHPIGHLPRGDRSFCWQSTNNERQIMSEQKKPEEQKSIPKSIRDDVDHIMDAFDEIGKRLRNLSKCYDISIETIQALSLQVQQLKASMPAPKKDAAPKDRPRGLIRDHAKSKGD